MATLADFLRGAAVAGVNATQAAVMFAVSGAAGGGAPTGHLYWRARSLSRSGSNSNLELSEFQFHSAAGRITGTLTITGGTSIANWNDNSLASAAFVSDGAQPAYSIQIQCASPEILTGIRIGAFDQETRFPTAIGHVEYSDDGTAWTRVGGVASIAYPGNNTLTPLLVAA